MGLKIGDKVKFLNEIGGGEIISFLDPGKVLVRIDDGFDMPVMLSELIATTDIQQEKPVRKVAETVPDSKAEKNSGEVYMAFMHRGNPYQMEIYLINDTNFHLYYTLGIRKMEMVMVTSSGLLESNTKLRVDQLKIEDPEGNLEYQIQYISLSRGFFEQPEPVSRRLLISARSLADQEYASVNDFFHEEVSLFTIGIDPSAEYEVNLKKKEAKREIRNKDIAPVKVKIPDLSDKGPDEIDLHIEAIMDDYRDLELGEILEIQLSRFTTALETAINSKTRRIIFIHGVGNGKLKYEIRKCLDVKYPDLKYQDASFKEYGYGATLVIIK